MGAPSDAGVVENASLGLSSVPQTTVNTPIMNFANQSGQIVGSIRQL